MTRTNNHDETLLERLEENENDIPKKEKSATDAFEKEELRSKTISNDSREQDRLLRGKYSGKLFVFMSVFLFLVMFFVFMSGIRLFNFELSDSVLITLLTTASANVIGIFAIVVRYLFNVPPESKNRRENGFIQ
ncbi:MAG: hypothetical protein LBQ73_10705 [Tannerellaceae bacterium]|jgi:hypothetical protein|nr:hypothetical protein [Tannerellaceae bacterium]